MLEKPHIFLCGFFFKYCIAIISLKNLNINLVNLQIV